MIPGVASLRCPACARPFLTLPKRDEMEVVCPHCRRTGPASSFAAAGGVAGNALVENLRHRVQPNHGGHAEVKAAKVQPKWPAAPPLFEGPVPETPPPLTAAEPQWPFLGSEPPTQHEAPTVTGEELPEWGRLGRSELELQEAEEAERWCPSAM